jgi:hypothetical protein
MVLVAVKSSKTTVISGAGAKQKEIKIRSEEII